jgi:hypothetical protein
MKRKILILVASLAVAAYSGIAQATIEGSWHCAYDYTRTVTNYKTGKVQLKQSNYTGKTFDFYSDGYYTETVANPRDMGFGTWRQKGVNITIKQNKYSVGDQVTYDCSAYSYCYVLSASSEAKLKERNNSNGRFLSGKRQEKVVANINGKKMRITIKASLVCHID